MNDALTMQKIQCADQTRYYQNGQEEAKDYFDGQAHWRLYFVLILDLEFDGLAWSLALGEDVHLRMGEVRIRKVYRFTCSSVLLEISELSYSISFDGHRFLPQKVRWSWQIRIPSWWL